MATDAPFSQLRPVSHAIRPGSRISGALIFLALSGYLAWVVFPMLWVAYSSLKPDEAIFRDAFALPSLDHLAWDNYVRAWREAHFGSYFFNSVLVTTVSVAGILALGSMAAYALSRFYHPLGKLLYWLFLAGLMIPVQLSIVPLFFELRGLGLLNSRAGLILVYVANGLPFAVFILANFFRALPKSLYEAAVVDGCTEASAFWRVMLPLAKPGLITVAIFQFIGIWKEYFFAFMFTSGSPTESVRTLPLGLANLSLTAQYRSDYGILFAGVVVVTIPILLIYLVLQKHLVKGVTAGALKG
ncbi:carbohydrate ABC transporter permease [Opitutaceae bacterium EW11]|nr:carbohydrate ABC transporter permease [Opitutaceae bacterium EW11]